MTVDVEGIVDSVVRIDWLDSGLATAPHCELETALGMELVTQTAYGKVVYADEDKVVIAHEHAPDGQGTYGVIWTPSIRVLEVLRDEVDEIVEEVEEQAAREESSLLPIVESCGACGSGDPECQFCAHPERGLSNRRTDRLPTQSACS